jgi:hypothetical protein
MTINIKITTSNQHKTAPEYAADWVQETDAKTVISIG